MESIRILFSHLKGKRFNLQDEKLLQAEMYDILKPLYGDDIHREVELDKENIIDFLIAGGIGIEVKIKGSKRNLYKQCERYCQFEEIKALVLITNLAVGFPDAINNKPCYVFKLSTAWL